MNLMGEENFFKRHRYFFQDCCFWFEGLTRGERESYEDIVKQLSGTIDRYAKHHLCERSYFEKDNINRDDLYNITYILDCMKANTILDIETYRFLSTTNVPNEVQVYHCCVTSKYILRTDSCERYYYKNICCPTCSQEKEFNPADSENNDSLLLYKSRKTNRNLQKPRILSKKANDDAASDGELAQNSNDSSTDEDLNEQSEEDCNPNKEKKKKKNRLCDFFLNYYNKNKPSEDGTRSAEEEDLHSSCEECPQNNEQLHQPCADTCSRTDHITQTDEISNDESTHAFRQFHQPCTTNTDYISQTDEISNDESTSTQSGYVKPVKKKARRLSSSSDERSIKLTISSDEEQISERRAQQPSSSNDNGEFVKTESSEWWLCLPTLKNVNPYYVEPKRTESDRRRGATFKAFEQRIMIAYLVVNNKIRMAKSRKPWHHMHQDGYLRNRSVESLSNNFRKHILPKIRDFGLPEEIVSEFLLLP